MNKNFLLYLCTAIFIAASAVSCNSDSDDDTDEIYSSSTAITSFLLGEDDDVLENLDSVHFTIDLDRCLIYNADSLPVGTDVTKLLVTLGYESAYSINWRILNGEVMTNDTTFTYSSSDSIDFSGEAYIIIVAADKVTQRTYTVNVNVHQVEPDSLCWGDLAQRDLPTLSGSATECRAVKYNDVAYILLNEGDSYTLASTDDPYGESWDQNEISFDFTPDVRSLTATSDALYILDDNGILYTSSDFNSWTSTGLIWESVSGAYQGYILGVEEDDDGSFVHAIYPDGSGFQPYEVEADFPIYQTSDMHTFTTKWNIAPVGLIMGGINASDELIGDTWGFDGVTWAQITDFAAIPHAGMVLIPYFTYETSTCWVVTEYSTWISFGGEIEDGSTDNTVYISRDNCVNWNQADTLMQMSEEMEAVTRADALLFNKTYYVETRSGSSVWTSYPSATLPPWCHILGSSSSTIATRTSTAVTEWDCPYIYLIGGYDSTGQLSNSIWRGVINRLTFKPIY